MSNKYKVTPTEALQLMTLWAVATVADNGTNKLEVSPEFIEMAKSLESATYIIQNKFGDMASGYDEAEIILSCYNELKEAVEQLNDLEH